MALVLSLSLRSITFPEHFWVATFSAGAQRPSSVLPGPSSPIRLTHLAVYGGSKFYEGCHDRNCNPAAAPDLPSLRQWLIETERNWAFAKHRRSWRDPRELVAIQCPLGNAAFDANLIKLPDGTVPPPLTLLNQI